MFCAICGYAVEEDDSFCRKCGSDVSGENPTSAVRLFRRDMARKKLFGVCSGFARYFAKDVTLIRIVWMGCAILPPFFPGVVAYGICWVLMPMDEIDPTDNGSPNEQAAVQE